MSRIIKSEEAVLEDFRVDLYRVSETEEPEKKPEFPGEEEYRKKYELISKEKKQILEHARIQAKQTASKILEDAYAQRDKIVNTAETEAKRLKQAAREEGFSEGLEHSKQFIRDSLNGLNEEFAELRREEEETFEQIRREVFSLAYNMTEKILKKKLKEDELVLLELVKSVLKEEADKKDIVVHLSGRAFKLAEELEEQLKPIREKTGTAIKIKKDEISESDLKIETDDGIIDASISVQLENLRKFLETYRED